MKTCSTCHDAPENCSCVDKIEPMNPFAGATLEQLGQWYCQMNCFRWPEDLPVAKPDGYDGMSDRERFRDPLTEATFRQLRAILSPRDRSRAWHIYELGRTEDQWQDWWRENSGLSENLNRLASGLLAAD